MKSYNTNKNINDFKGMVGQRIGHPDEVTPIQGEEIDGRPDLDPTMDAEIGEYHEDFFDDSDNG